MRRNTQHRPYFLFIAGLLLLLLLAVGCERRKDEMWIPGAKPTAISAKARALALEHAQQAQAEDDEAAARQEEAADSDQAAGTTVVDVLPQLKQELHALQRADRAKDRFASEEAFRKVQALDREAVSRELPRILAANEDDLGVSAALLMGKLKLTSGLQALSTRLAGDDIFMAQAAARALGEIGSPVAVDQLVDQAKRHNSASVRAASLEALGRIGDRTALPRVLDTVHDPDPSVREAAAHIVGRLGNAEEHRETLHALMKDSTARVRLNAVLALAELRAPEAVDNLVDLLEDDSEESRRSAEAALISFPDRGTVRRKLMEALEQRSGSALLSYSQALKSICDCSCRIELNSIAERTPKPIVKNACLELSRQITATCTGSGAEPPERRVMLGGD